MRTLFQKLGEVLRNGEDAVLVTVVAASGSTPRGAGARMLVTAQGQIYGTIGGGAVEYRSEQLAIEALRTRRSRTETFMLYKNDVQDLGMICGGDVTIYFHFIPARSPEMLALTDQAEELFAAGEQSWLVLNLGADGAQGMALYGRQSGGMGAALPPEVVDALSSTPRQIDMDGCTWYADPLIPAGRVYIFGGGHVAQALVPALSAVDFRCVIVEDREEFCTPALFPGVEQTRRMNPEHIGNSVTIGPEDYVCIMTRGHKDDLRCEAFALTTPACYIGVIGSRRKTAAVNASLMEMGYTQQDLDRVTTPIGLAIAAQTPAEIAVSITAQLIAVRAERRGH